VAGAQAGADDVALALGEPDTFERGDRRLDGVRWKVESLDELVEAVALLRRADDELEQHDPLSAVLSDVTWIPVDAAEAGDALAPVHDAAVASARAVIDAASAGAGDEAIEALGAFRILCAHRRGDHGVTAWTSRVETWLAVEIPSFGAEGDWYVGRPLLVTENDYALRL
jgi:exodeoxyribonuclease V alpha subunit